MDSRLFMEIGINDNGNLYVVDNSPYERWIEEYEEGINHIVFERVVEYDLDNERELNIIEENSTHPSSIEELCSNKEFDLPKDGLYLYQKMIIPTEEHRGESTCYAKEVVVKQNGIDLVDFAIYIEENGEERQIDFTEAFDYVNDVNTGNAFWFDDYVFSIFNLIKCYVLMEKQRIANWLKNNCKANCDTISTINTNADMLMVAVTVLTYLISKRQFVEAYRLLNGLETCGNLCKDFRNDIKGCGCGKSVY